MRCITATPRHAHCSGAQAGPLCPASWDPGGHDDEGARMGGRRPGPGGPGGAGGRVGPARHLRGRQPATTATPAASHTTRGSVTESTKGRGTAARAIASTRGGTATTATPTTATIVSSVQSTPTSARIAAASRPGTAVPSRTTATVTATAGTAIVANTGARAITGATATTTDRYRDRDRLRRPPRRLADAIRPAPGPARAGHRGFVVCENGRTAFPEDRPMHERSRAISRRAVAQMLLAAPAAAALAQEKPSEPEPAKPSALGRVHRGRRARTSAGRARAAEEEHRGDRAGARGDPRLQAASRHGAGGALPGAEVEAELTMLGPDVLYLSAIELGAKLRAKRVLTGRARGVLPRADGGARSRPPRDRHRDARARARAGTPRGTRDRGREGPRAAARRSLGRQGPRGDQGRALDLGRDAFRRASRSTTTPPWSAGSTRRAPCSSARWR